MKTTIQTIKAAPGQRIIAVSDVHGHLNHLIQLLKKINYSGDDILVIVGDIVDKGPDSLRTLQYVMELAKRESVTYRGDAIGFIVRDYMGCIEKGSLFERADCAARLVCGKHH